MSEGQTEATVGVAWIRDCDTTRRVRSSNWMSNKVAPGATAYASVEARHSTRSTQRAGILFSYGRTSSPRRHPEEFLRGDEGPYGAVPQAGDPFPIRRRDAQATGLSADIYTPNTQIFLAFLCGVYILHTGSWEKGRVWRQLWRRIWCGVMDSRTVIRRLEQDGWVQKRVKGSHHHFRHPSKPGTVTVPHPEKDLTIATLKSIERQSGLTLTGQ